MIYITTPMWPSPWIEICLLCLYICTVYSKVNVEADVVMSDFVTSVPHEKQIHGVSVSSSASLILPFQVCRFGCKPVLSVLLLRLFWKAPPHLSSWANKETDDLAFLFGLWLWETINWPAWLQQWASLQRRICVHCRGVYFSMCICNSVITCSNLGWVCWIFTQSRLQWMYTTPSL